MSIPYKCDVSHFVSYEKGTIDGMLGVKGGYMDQIKIGTFLKELRREKELTQGELAEKLNVSNRSVSRWETGNTLPDISILIELAEYYEVDIKEILDGERKSENMKEETKGMLLQIAEYTDKQKKQVVYRAIVCFGLEMLFCGISICAGYLVLISNGQISVGYAVIPMIVTFSLSIGLLINVKDYLADLVRKRRED